MLGHNIRLAWQLYQQEKRAAHNRILAWVQAILLTFVVSLSLVSGSIQGYLAENLQNLLGADVVINQPYALTTEQTAQFEALSDSTIFTQYVKTTLTHDGEWQRITLKAVGDDYPLQGDLKVSTSRGSKAQTISSGPAMGEIWPDERLSAGLSLELGDEVTIAEQIFTVTKLLQHEPDRFIEGHNVDMRALIHRYALPHLGIADDDIHYRYMATASGSQVKAILNWQKARLPAAAGESL